MGSPCTISTYIMPLLLSLYICRAFPEQDLVWDRGKCMFHTRKRINLHAILFSFLSSPPAASLQPPWETADCSPAKASTTAFAFLLMPSPSLNLTPGSCPCVGASNPRREKPLSYLWTRFQFFSHLFHWLLKATGTNLAAKAVARCRSTRGLGWLSESTCGFC